MNPRTRPCSSKSKNSSISCKLYKYHAKKQSKCGKKIVFLHFKVYIYGQNRDLNRLKNEINDGKEYFRYKQVEHTKNPNVGQFDVLLEQNLITVDLLLCRPSGNGDTYSFKIKKKGMPLLFPESVIYNI